MKRLLFQWQLKDLGRAFSSKAARYCKTGYRPIIAGNVVTRHQVNIPSRWKAELMKKAVAEARNSAMHLMARRQRETVFAASLLEDLTEPGLCGPTCPCRTV